MNREEMTICLDCRHCTQDDSELDPVCAAKAVAMKPVINPVTGEDSFIDPNDRGKERYYATAMPPCRLINRAGSCPHYVKITQE